jgi:hypothetical protein
MVTDESLTAAGSTRDGIFASHRLFTSWIRNEVSIAAGGCNRFGERIVTLLSEVGGGVSQAAESVQPLVRRVERGFGRGDWTEGGCPNWVPAVTGIIIAAALGGALMYFLDPENGPRRRQRVLSVKLRAKDAANKASEAVEEVGVTGRG